MKDNLARLNTAIERELREAESRRERRRAEEERRLAEEKYRGIFENAVEGIFQTTVEGRFVTANPALRWRACSATTRPRICSRTSPTSRSSST
jgi:hypothetical protein